MRNLPSELASVLNDAAERIDADGNLPASVRLQLHQHMERLSVQQHANAAYFRRVRLSFASARSVVHLLDGFEPAKTQAGQLLRYVERHLNADSDLHDLERQNERFHVIAEDLVDVEEDKRALAAMYAAMTTYGAVRIVLYDMDLVRQLGASELEVDSELWDPAFYAATAISGSAPWEHKGGADLRRRFWRWYLTTAFLFAWDVEGPLSEVGNVLPISVPPSDGPVAD